MIDDHLLYFMRRGYSSIADSEGCVFPQHDHFFLARWLRYARATSHTTKAIQVVYRIAATREKARDWRA